MRRSQKLDDARLQPPQGIAAMQSINITVINPWFMTAFFGTAAAWLAKWDRS